MMINRSETTTREGLGLLALLVTVLGFLALLSLVPGAVHAQDLDARWLPWSGCWELVGSGAEGDVVCVRPHEDEGAVSLVSSREEVSDRVIRADGVARPVEQAGCEGTERAWFSDDGRRIYVESAFQCEGSVAQSGSGLIAMVAEDEWVDIRSLSQDGEEVAWVQRYVQATPAAVQAAGETDLLLPQVALARRLAARAPSIRTLADVSRSVDGRVASAWIVESGHPFEGLDGETLIAMADAGVDSDVIDMAIAVSNPQYFNVGAAGEVSEQQARSRGYVGSYGYQGYLGSRYGSPYSPWGYLYRPYGYYGYGSFYNPWGGYYGGYYGYGYGGYRPSVLVVSRRTGDNNGGRAVAGQGYRSGRSGSPPSASQGYRPPRSSGARPSGGYTGSGSRGTTSSGGSTGTRTAKPRGGGGI
ncbi:MAG: hypothetical protein JSU98_15485 [Gemmatimonadales bacterium]|jgi:hypothetical protein|nr:MAG: hypothetical protein JSU98_15485 [Gemmatimonadales bacterium]